jgi:hypothetical protein
MTNKAQTSATETTRPLAMLPIDSLIRPTLQRLGRNCHAACLGGGVIEGLLFSLDSEFYKCVPFSVEVEGAGF